MSYDDGWREGFDMGWQQGKDEIRSSIEEYIGELEVEISRLRHEIKVEYTIASDEYWENVQEIRSTKDVIKRLKDLL